MHPLDNVIWSALTTRQAHLAEASALARRFPSEVTLLGGIRESSAEGYESLAALLSQRSAEPNPSQTQARRALVCLFFDKTPGLPAGWIIESSGAMLQMICEEEPRALSNNGDSSKQFSTLCAADSPEMLALAQLTKPGPFGLRTYELGTYLGIRHGGIRHGGIRNGGLQGGGIKNGGARPSGELVAMAGERLRVPGFTEISAVCTHPSHVGHGYAALLMTELIQRIHARGEQPFLHVRADNRRAIELYERLAFRERARRHYAVLRYERAS